MTNTMDLTSAQSSTSGGCIILLDVPPGSAITIDGTTRLTPSSSSSLSNASGSSSSTSSFNHGVLVISGIPSSSTLSNPFHLLIVRCGSTNKNQTDCDIRTLPIGFILTDNNRTQSSNSNHNQHNDGSGYDLIFARRYDPQTEEISNKSIDDITLNNILLALRKGGELAMNAMMGTNFIMSYEQFMQSPSSKSGSSNNITVLDSKSTSSWIARTTCINSSYLEHCHSVGHGDKIVPSSYNHELEDIQSTRSSNDNTIMSSSAQDEDGIQISYPQIPCIDPSINARRLTQHTGTRSYLSNLSPETRTKLLLGVRGGDDSFHPGEYVWNDILSTTYSGNETHFLADVQLSFLLFLFLECHTSLEHWRDAISMCSLAVMSSSSHRNILHKHPNFFERLLSIIHDQFLCIETEFFQEVEYSSGQKNFLIQALERLCGACDDIMVGDGNRDIDNLKTSSIKLKRMLRDRFQLELSSSLTSMNDADMDIDQECPPIVYESNENRKSSSRQTSDFVEHGFDDDEDDEDGPVVVPYDEFESSLSRSAALPNSAQKHKNINDVEDAKYRHEYPLLFAAMSPQEDVLMCAARVLDEQRDVSLVREAAAYLEKVEAYRCT